MLFLQIIAAALEIIPVLMYNAIRWEFTRLRAAHLVAVADIPVFTKEDIFMKALGILMVGLLAVAGGVAAATYITKKKLEKENDDNYYDDWDDEFDDDLDFDADAALDDASSEETEDEAAPAAKLADELTEEKTEDDESDL